MITTMKADICRLDFDIIVNPTNTHFGGGYGVSQEILKLAGPALSRKLHALGSCEIGQAKMTLAYDLPSKIIIHTAQPTVHDGKEFLEACYWNCMALAFQCMKKNHMERLTLAYPVLATGVYGFSHEQSCTIAIQTVQKMYREYPETKAIDVVFVCRMEQDYLLYKEGLKRI